jgi:hypothetical protein
MKISVKRSPNTVTTPELKSSFSASTSLVTRVIRRPTGFRSKKRRLRPLEVREELHPEVVHDPLTDPGGQQRLCVLEDEGEEQ